MKIVTMAAMMSAASIWAAQPTYFPLQVGNQWVLQTTSGTPELLSIDVLRSRVQNGETYFLVSGYAPGQRWLRQTHDGDIVTLDEKSGREETVAHLSADDLDYRTSLGACEQVGHPVSMSAPYRSANFVFPRSLAITYEPGACRDVGFQYEIYSPDVGIVRRSITTVHGTMTFDLAYARVNGSPVLGKSKEIVMTHNFNHGTRGWLAGFTDYNLRASDLRMIADVRALPEEVDPSRSGFFIQSMNRSDDLFMFLKKHVSSEDGLEPNQLYLVSFDLRMSSNSPTGCAGIGGSPGDSVYLKAGASTDEPLASLAGAGEVRLTIDKGQQSIGGRDAGIVGTIANGTICTGPTWPYVSFRREYAHPFAVRTDDRASLWLIAGTDSAYEGLTGLYFESITVRINPAVAPAGSSFAK
jgi:hypothetical protein